MILERAEDLIEEIIKPFEHSHSIKDVVNDIEPPESLALFDLCRFGHGKHRRWRFAERTAEGLGDLYRRVWLLVKPKLNSMVKIQLCH